MYATKIPGITIPGNKKLVVLPSELMKEEDKIAKIHAKMGIIMGLSLLLKNISDLILSVCVLK